MPQSDFTISALVYLKSYQTYDSPIVDEAGASNYHGYTLFICDNCGHRLKLTLGWGQDIISGLTVGLNQWHFVSASYSLSARKAYFCVDGTCVNVNDTTTYGYQPQINHLRIGYNNWAYGGQYFNGTIDEVRIYNRAIY
jgi:hypothetical protein